jgi:transaldolase / glucose-6-phosphate isomerase
MQRVTGGCASRIEAGGAAFPKNGRRTQMNPLRALEEQGQAVWLDFLARRFIADGSLKALIETDGLKGVTSNPAIFEKAIDAGEDYGDALSAAEKKADRTPIDLYEGLAIADIQAAADVLRPVFDTTGGADGFVSLEVSPYLALNTKATIAEARRLWHAVRRDNLMIKVPGTDAGLPAIRQLLGEGINVNITLLFSQTVYEKVAEAYLAGAERFAADGGDLARLASVASFFVSRIDTAVDTRIDERRDNALAALKGKVAVANAKLAYARFKRLFAGARWKILSDKGARPQRLLWASTGTKNKAYSDVLYVETLIGRDTVNTMPPATMDAFREHGKVAPTIEQGLDEAQAVMAALERGGISIEEVCAKLVEDGVQLFAAAADKLLGAVARKRAALLEGALGTQHMTLPAPLQKELDAAQDSWRAGGKGRRLWARDASLWTGGDEASWLGWLDVVAKQRARLDELQSFAAAIAAERLTHILLLGMGGSSLGPEVIAETFGPQPDRPQLLVLDSTDPAQIRAFEHRIDPARTLYIVSSKSGTTLEPNILMQYFFARAEAALGKGKAGARFVAITDPGSKLEAEAKAHGFRAIFFGLPTIGGRYSVLSDFGLVPAAAMGVDVERLIASTELMVRACDGSAPPADNPGIALGLALGHAATAGRDKVTIFTSPGLADFGAWLEQLLAESTGKRGRGIVPVDGEPLAPPERYGQDRVFVAMRLASEDEQQEKLAALEHAGHPVLRFAVADDYAIGQEFFRWEIATAVAGAVIGIDPFDQPDVEASKAKTRELTTAFEQSGKLPAERPFLEERGVALYADPRNEQALAGHKSLADAIGAHLARLGAGDYCALLAYIERNERHIRALRDIRTMLRDRKRVATCVGFGPRFLHSTGQAYKGGPNSGVFLQITCDAAEDLAVPGQKYTFGLVEAAQARGDFEVLAERGRRALRVHLGRDVEKGLSLLAEVVRANLA